MASFILDFGLMWYFGKLNKKEFMKFKDFLIQEILKLKLKQISWTGEESISGRSCQPLNVMGRIKPGI